MNARPGGRNYADIAISDFLDANANFDWPGFSGAQKFLKFHISMDGGHIWSRQITAGLNVIELYRGKYFDRLTGAQDLNLWHRCVDRAEDC